MKWEYFVAPLLEHNPGEILNSFGEDGWELVTILQQQTPAGGVSMVAYMKRKASSRTGFGRCFGSTTWCSPFAISARRRNVSGRSTGSASSRAGIIPGGVPPT
jgi:hypothetical protein